MGDGARRGQRRTSRPGRWPPGCRWRGGLPQAPFGSWPSPISAADVARGRVRLSFPTVIGADVWWQEGRPDEGGRITVMHRGPDGKQRALLPAPWNARTRVHEYGGLSYLPVPPGLRPRAGARGIVCSRTSPTSGCTWPAGASGRQPRPLTPDPAAAGAASGEPCGLRFADFALSPDGAEVWCVQELHNGGKVTRSIVAVPLDGSAADDPTRSASWSPGSDFFAFPTPSPDGSRLAWICWNHPHMPWDGTELRVAPVARAGSPGQAAAGQGRHAGVGAGAGVAGQHQPVRGHRLDRLVEHLPGRADRRAAAGAVPGRGGVRRARCGSWAPARSPCSATAGWPCCTAAAASGSGCSTRRPPS